MIDIELINCIEDLLEAIPKQDNDRDWWPDELNKAVREAKALIKKRNEEMEYQTNSLLLACENALSYLNSFRKEWKEGEEILSFELQAAIEKATNEIKTETA